MSKYKIALPTIILFIALFQNIQMMEGQETMEPLWVQKMYGPQADVEEITALYEAYYRTHPFEKNRYTQDYKRWLRNISRDLTGAFNPNLSLAERAAIKSELKIFQKQSLRTQRNATSTWIGIGPYDWDHDAASRSYAPGAAHIYTVEQAPSDDNILYAGTATAGMWKSIDHGQSWNCITLDLMENRVYALDIHPTNPDIIVADLFDNIFISLDGGMNWSPTGNTTFQNLTMDVYDILFHRNSGNLIFAATSEGLYRSDDMGDNWTEVISNKTQEIEIHPTNDDVFYAIEQVGNNTGFYRSNNMGLTFTQQSNGWPTAGENRRAEIAVSADAPDKVFALLTGVVNGGSGLYGIYTSDDEGTNWAFNCCGPQPGGPADLNTVPPNINMMGWSDVGSDNGGQYYYDLALAVSPTNADSVFVGAVNMWVSSDGGQSFVCPSKWSHSYKPNYVHADIHDINFYENGELWIACDGGIFYSDDDAANMNRSMTGIEGSDFWGFGANYWSGNVMLGGAYHNGTLIKNENVYINDWACIDGGDGTGGYANVGIENRVYSNYNIKDLPADRTTPIPTRGYANKPYMHYVVGRSSQITFHPNNYSQQYFGKDTCIYITRDDHYTSEPLHCFGEAVADVEISSVNPDYIYVATFPSHWSEKKIYKTSDGGTNWTDITPSTAIFSSTRWLPYDLTLSDTDPEVIYMARVANSVATYDGQKIYKSSNGGVSWTNMTTAELDGEQLTNIVFQRGTQDGLWVGTRRTVYYKSANQSDWMLCNTDLPASTFSTKMVINYRTQTIKNATNRSVYEASLIDNVAPKALITVNKNHVRCARDTFYFSDYSAVSENSATWSWSFPGATYISSTTTRTPKVIYGNPGTYNVSLSVSDAYGSDAMTLNNFIEVESLCSVDTIPGQALQTITSGDYAQLNVGLLTNTFTISAWVKPDGIQPEYSSIFMSNDDQAGFNFKQNNLLGYHWPGGQWWWNSSLSVPSGEWSHVAMTVDPEGVTVYLNGVADRHTISLNQAVINSAYMASYRGWTSRNFIGELDEITIWNRTLSATEIREFIHLTREKEVPSDPTLFAYYQFNEADGNIFYDKKGSNHATAVGGSIRSMSLAPVGAGSSSTQIISAADTYNFLEEGVTLHLNTITNQPVVVSKINWTPHGNLPYDLISDKYYAIHDFSPQTDLIIDTLFIHDENLESNCSNNFIFHRTFNDVGNNWVGPVHPAERCESNTMYFSALSVNKKAQLAIGRYDGNFYVDETSTSLLDGRSWESAFDQLQTALHLAGLSDTIFVAQGLYVPRAYPRNCLNCSDLRQQTFNPRTGVTIMGGFPTFGSALHLRDWESYPTILSGRRTEDPALNVYHVVYVDDVSSSINMDGFYVKDGLANGISNLQKEGAALYCEGGIQLRDIEFSNHHAQMSLVFVNGEHADIQVMDSRLINSTTDSLKLNVDNQAKALFNFETTID